MSCNNQCDQCGYASYCDMPGAGFSVVGAERNIPQSPNNSLLGDAHLDSLRRRPVDWRWRMPELDETKELNSMINVVDYSEMPTLDSFAAFAETSISPGTTTSNTFLDAISGIVRQVTPVAGQAVSQAINRYAPAYQAPQQAAPQQAAARAMVAAANPSSNMMPILLIGGVAVLAIVLMSGKK